VALLAWVPWLNAAAANAKNTVNKERNTTNLFISTTFIEILETFLRI